jgi:hypothetical protein
MVNCKRVEMADHCLYPDAYPGVVQLKRGYIR